MSTPADGLRWRATDPAGRQRLKDKAMRIREKTEQENGRGGSGSGTMDPM
ncbi:DUF6381 family protein [Streptomyces sp. NPDC059355]